MVKNESKHLEPKKFTEECALVSVFLNMTQINDDWFLNYISAPGGSWQEYFIKLNGKTYRYYIGKIQGRTDLTLQKDTKKQFLCFFIAEAKETYLKVLQEKNKIHRDMINMFKIIAKSKIEGKHLYSLRKIKPIYAFIVGLDVAKLDKDTRKEVLITEKQRISKTIDKSFKKIRGGRACILTYRIKDKTKFDLIFSKDFPKEVKNYFHKLFDASKKRKSKTMFKYKQQHKVEKNNPGITSKKERKTKKKKKNKSRKSIRIDLGERGVYDIRNTLNDLTGKEWKFMSRSVITRSYPPDLQHQLRKKHGGQKPPQLCADLIKTFTKKGQIVLDPLMGVGGTLLGAALCNRKAIGIDINKRWIDIYKNVCDLEGLKEFGTFHGDCRDILKKFSKNSIDFILTDVPYWKMDKVKKTRSKAAAKSHLSKFNNKEIQTKQKWLDELIEIFSLCYKVLKNKKYLAIFIGDMYRGSRYHMLSTDLANAIQNETKFTLKANLIWYDVSKNLHVFGQPHAFVPSMIHQNILIFRKE